MGCLFKTALIFLTLEFVHAENYGNYYFPELKYVDKNMNPCDDFYKYACGNFEKYNPKPDGEVLWDNFKILQEEIDEIAIKILNSKIHPHDPQAVRKAKQMYKACRDMTRINRIGLQPMKSVIEELDGWPIISYPEHMHVEFKWETIGELIAKYGVPLIFNWNVGPYIRNTDINMIMLSRDPLVFPASANANINQLPKDIFEEATGTTQERAQQPPHVEFMNFLATEMKQEMGSFVTEETIEEGVQGVLDIMLKIHGSEKTAYNGTLSESLIDTVEDLQTWTDTFAANFKTRIDWLSFFNSAFSFTGSKVTKDTKVYVGNKNMTANILTMVENTDPEVLKNFVIMRLMIYMSPDTTTRMWEKFNWLYRQLGYSVFPREQYCMRKVSGYPNMGLSMAIAHDYQNYYFSLKKMAQPREMIDDLMSAFFELLQENDWMDDAAREWVVDKANKMVRLIGFPEFVYDTKKLNKYYSDLRVCANDHFGNSQKIRTFNFAKNLEGIDKPRERATWTQSPLYVNAFYNQLNNRITFPAGIMNPPFYTGRPSIVDYTRIGALIGHEITHGFDSKGRNTDANGSMVGSAFSQDVKDAFERKEQCFRKQYSQYYIDEIQLYVNGNISLSENIADNGGVREAYRAYQKLLRRQLSKTYSNKEYSVDQLFFISYATMWCKIDTVQSLSVMYRDSHAPNRFRVIGTLSNMKEFAEAFSCPTESYMNPTDKCVLW